MRTHLLLCCLTLPLAAQNDFVLAKTSSGTLGKSLDLAFASAPAGKSLLFMLSATAGPTPLSLIDPADPRHLEVGLDAAAVWQVLGTGGGSGTIPLPVPNAVALAGAGVHFQTCTLPGTTTIVDKISNRVFVLLGAADTAVASPNPLTGGRALMATFPNKVLSTGQGDVILAGGGQGGLLGATGLDTSDVYDFHTMSVKAGPKLNSARALHVTVGLKDGRMLLAGGTDQTGAAIATAEIYDPATHKFTPTGSMSLARAAHAGALLPDGRVLVVGGTTILTDPVQALANAQSSAEIYNPATGLWSSAASIGSRRLAPSLDTLPNGKVLVSGGFEVTVLFGIPIPTGAIKTCQLYTYGTNSWAAAAAMPNARAVHSLNSIVLTDGKLLVTGGATSGPDLTQATAIAKADLYDPIANNWTPLADMRTPRTGHTVTRISNGDVVVIGGASGTMTAPTSLAEVDRFVLASRTWAPLPNLQTTRAGHGAFVTPDGLLVVFGGSGGPANTTLASIEVIH